MPGMLPGAGYHRTLSARRNFRFTQFSVVNRASARCPPPGCRVVFRAASAP